MNYEFGQVKGSCEKMIVELNAWGADGWDCIELFIQKNTDSYHAIMKRPFPVTVAVTGEKRSLVATPTTLTNAKKK